MKLQLPVDRVAHFATICGPLTGDLASDTTRILGAFRTEKHDPYTRKDVVAILLHLGETEEVHRDEKWAIIGKVLRDVSIRVVRRGYYTQFEGEVQAAPVKKKAPKPKKNRWAPPAEPTTTGKWFVAQIRDKRLDRKVAALLKRKFSQESYEDLLSETREWFVRWSNRGTCDEYIEKGKPPTVTVLTIWLSGKITCRLYKEGKDALQREKKGVRTQFELRTGQETGKDYVREDTLIVDTTAPGAIWVLEGDGESRRREFVQPELDEDLGSLFDDRELAVARDIVRAARQRAGDRYARIFDHLVVDGKSRKDAAALEGVSELRITHLFQKVRDDLRQGPRMLEIAMQVLKLISDEPFSTMAELEEDLTRVVNRRHLRKVMDRASVEDTEKNAPLDDKELTKALSFLTLRGLALEADGNCFAPTSLGRETVEKGHFV